MDKFYTGVGSRETPHDVLQLMTYTAKKLDEQWDYIPLARER